MRWESLACSWFVLAACCSGLLVLFRESPAPLVENAVPQAEVALSEEPVCQDQAQPELAQPDVTAVQ